MSNTQNITQEIRRIETATLNVKKEIKTLKNRVRAYKGWTKRYRKQQQELKQDNLVISKQRDQALEELQDLKTKQKKLLISLEEGRQAKELRDQKLSQLDDLIIGIEAFKITCQNFNKMTYASKKDLIKEAENLLFGESILDETVQFDSKSQSQMFTDQASIGRNLLDR